MTKPLRHTIRRIHRLHQISDTSFDRHVDAGFLPVRGILSLRSDYSRAASNPLFSLFFSPPRWFGPRWRAVLLICVRRGFESRNRGNRDYLILDDGKKVKERKKERNERFFSFYFRFFLSFRGKNVSMSGKFLEIPRRGKKLEGSKVSSSREYFNGKQEEGSRAK